jgi:lipid A 4'-phosphatase
LAHYYRQFAGAFRPVLLSNWNCVTSYLRLRRTHVLLGCFLLSSVLLVAFAHLDLRIAALFYDHGFYMATQAWTQLLHAGVTWFIVGSVASMTALYAFNRFTRRKVWGVDGRKLAYVLLVLVLGAGLLVNVILKDNFGRARPRDVEEFGGSLHFTPAYVITSECDRNCSFASGDAAGAFFALAFVLASSRRRAVSAAGIGFGVLVSAARIASGAHWFSDTVVSFFIMLIVADALYYQMFVYSPTAAAGVPEVGPGVLVKP